MAPASAASCAAVDVDLDRIRADIARQAEQVVLEQALGGHVAAAPEQDLEHRRFAPEKGSHRAVDDHLPPLGIERHVAEGQPPAEQVARAAQQRPAGGQPALPWRRACHVVVGPSRRPVTRSLTPSRAVRTRTGVEIAAPAQVAQQLSPSLSGQAEVEHDGGIAHGRQDVRRIAGGAHQSAKKIPLGDALSSKRDQLRIVFDQQHPHRRPPPLIAVLR